MIQVESKIKDKFILMYGDDLYAKKDIKQMIDNNCSLLIQYKNDPSAFGVIVLKDNFVTDIIEKPKKPISNYVNTGLYLLDKSIFNYLKKIKISERGEYELTDAIKLLIQEQKVKACKVQGYWIPIGYPWNILEATKKLLEIKKNKIDIGKNSTIHKTCDISGNIIIGDNCVIGENCQIYGFTIIESGTKISNNCKINNTLIGKSCQINKNCSISDSIIRNEVLVDENIIFNNFSDEEIKIKSPVKTFNSKKKKLGAFILDKCKISSNLKPGDCIIN